MEDNTKELFLIILFAIFVVGCFFLITVAIDYFTDVQWYSFIKI